MSVGSQPVTVTPATDPPRQPRRAVIDAAWQAIGPGTEVLSGDDGAPLRRTIKRILDPLVLRLRANPEFGAPIVTAEVAAAMHEVITGHGPRLCSAAAWFVVLKQTRRRLRITTGNAQELYFPICFELAVTKGAPAEGDPQVAVLAESLLRELHAEHDRTAVESLNSYVAQAGVVSALSQQLERSWHDVRADSALTGPFLSGLSTVLGSARGQRERTARQRVWTALIADPTPYNLGAQAHTDSTALPWSIVAVGLSSADPQLPPPVLGPASGDRPLDRSVLDRVRATLRRALDRGELPEIPLLCAEEVDRCCAPWGLLGEDRQASLVAGVELAGELAPLTDTAAGRYELAADIAARLRKEAYVLHARRYLADGAAVHPRQQSVIDELSGFARPYLGRLWARLHGRDVWQEPCDDVDEVRTLLAGIARSVSLDHRQRIKTMLALVEAG